MRVPTCVWRITPELVLALDAAFGTPTDSYVNGSQTWLLDNGPGETTLEWRLHPAPRYALPTGASHYDVWEEVVQSLAGGAPQAVAVGDAALPLDAIWDGLECFPAYDDELEPGPLAGAATAAIGIAPDASGMVDHDAIGEAWERSQRSLSIIDALFEQLHES